MGQVWVRRNLRRRHPDAFDHEAGDEDHEQDRVDQVVVLDGLEALWLEDETAQQEATQCENGGQTGTSSTSEKSR